MTLLVVTALLFWMMLLLLPRAVTRLITRAALWRLRDDAFDAGLDEGAHSDTDDFVALVEVVMANLSSFTALRMAILNRTVLRAARELRDPRAVSLSESPAFLEYMHRLQRIVLVHVVLGSWTGLGFAVITLSRAWIRSRRRTTIEPLYFALRPPHRLVSLSDRDLSAHAA